MGRRERQKQENGDKKHMDNKTDDQATDNRHHSIPSSSSEQSTPDRHNKRQRLDRRSKGTNEETPPRESKRKRRHEDNEYHEGPIRIINLSTSESLILVKESESILLKGKMQVQCIHGELEVFGYKLKPDNKFYDIFSPETNSSISLTVNKGSSVDHLTKDIRSYLQQVGKEEETKITNFLKDCRNSWKTEPLCVLRAKELDSPACDFISSISIYRNVFQSVPDSFSVESLGAQFLWRSDTGGLSIPRDFQKLSKSFLDAMKTEGSPTMVVCGGKNVGKSTLCRYILNTCLNSSKSVAYLECDIGQTELTPPGCLSLSVVDQPLLGPPFTHQRHPLCSIFYGALTPGDDPGRYLSCVSYLIDKYRGLEGQPPLVVNTMGWNKGLGISILIDTVKAIQPNYLVQLDSRSRTKNMPNLTAEFFELTPGWENIDLHADKSFSEVTLTFNHVVLQSPVSHENESSERYKAPDHRHLSLLGYLGGMMQTPQPLRSLQPYRVPWSSVAVHVCHCPVPNSQVLAALNASVVALCSVDPAKILQAKDKTLPRFLSETPICECLGIGLVRSIDEVEKVFHVLTPVEPAQLGKVNCLLRGALDLPQQVYMEQKSSTHVPYIGFPKDGIGATSNKRRRHLQRHRPR